MIVLKMLLAAIAFVLLIGPLNAHANIIYNWTGVCQGIAPVFNTGCTGQATLHVVTTDAYMPGVLWRYSACITRGGLLRQHPYV